MESEGGKKSEAGLRAILETTEIGDGEKSRQRLERTKTTTRDEVNIKTEMNGGAILVSSETQPPRSEEVAWTWTWSSRSSRVEVDSFDR